MRKEDYMEFGRRVSKARFEEYCEYYNEDEELMRDHFKARGYVIAR